MPIKELNNLIETKVYNDVYLSLTSESADVTKKKEQSVICNLISAGQGPVVRND